ncbi:MAG: DUF4338 domain-containing protein, partial [Bacillota bacterium]|nr:DUF4338 domain-containing protein [Bacillota bacterium]
AKKQICLPNIQKQGRQPGTRDIIKLQIHDTTEITCSIKIGHLASHILGRVCRRISTDWQEKYGHPIYLLETFVEQNRFKGTCYKAANWINVGETTGRSRNDRHTSLRLKMPQ